MAKLSAKLSANQETLLLVMIDEADRWWTAAMVCDVWPDSASRGVVLGMALRGLWTRGLANRDHGPPAAYRLTRKGKATGACLKLRGPDDA